MGIPRGVLAAALVVSCGGAQHEEKPREPAPKVVMYAPLGSKADAKSPQQAVILGTDDHGGSTVLALPAPGKTAVDVAAGKTMTNVVLATTPAPDQGAVDATGSPAWRSGVWTSALVAASTLDKDVTDYTFATTGSIDASSAVVAAGFIATLTGSPIDASATLTGMLDPDGTLAPADGIADAFLAALDKGKKRVGYPAGMRMAKSASGEPVDLAALARQHGAEAVEIGDVHDAYRLLTGKTLPAPVPVPEADMALDAATTAALDAKYKDWQTRVGSEWATLVQLESAGRLPPILVAMRTYAKTNAETAEALYRRGLVGAAYSRMLAAWAFASATTHAYDVLQKVQGGNLAAAIDEIKALDRLRDSAAVLQQIGAITPTTLTEHLQMLAAFEAALRANVFEQMAGMSVSATVGYLTSLQGVPTAQLGAPEAADKVMEAVAPTLLYVARSAAESKLATQVLELEHEQSVAYQASPASVKRVAAAYQSAGAANLAYLDTLLTQPLAEQNKISEDEARKLVAQLEPDSYVAWQMTRLGHGSLDDLQAAWGEQSLAWQLLSLAGSELAYYDAAGLVAKYASLHAQTDDSGKIDKVVSDQALAQLLAAGERTARASAHEAKIAAGAIPVQAKLAYQLAQVERDGDLADKLDALTEYWAATKYAQAAVMLARN